MILQGYQWAAGFNNAGALKAVEVDIPLFQGKPCYVHGLGQFNEGVSRPRADKTDGWYGFKTFVWVADVMSDTQLNYIRTTYAAGGPSAKMTARTLRNGSFANFSAVLHLPAVESLTRKWNVYTDVPLSFTIEAIL